MLYRVVQEALTNVAKHAGRGVRVTVRLAWAALAAWRYRWWTAAGTAPGSACRPAAWG